MGRKKRGIDFDSERLSPPNKMTRNESQAAIMAKLDSLEAKIGSLESRFAKVEQEVTELNRIISSFEGIREEIGSLKESQESFQRLEIESKKRCVLIKGLKFRSKGKFETRAETREALASFFGLVGLVGDERPHLVDYQRLGGLRAGEDGAKVAIRVEFSDVDQRIGLFEKLKTKGRELKEYSVQTDYPKFQLQTFKQLSEQAYNIRKAQAGTRTRIIPKGLGLALQTRASTEEKWTAVSQGRSVPMD
jgi:hypothetical protein